MWDLQNRPRVNNNGYVYVRIPEHPRATSTGYVYEHQLVAENKLGRMLNPDEVVHHLDHNRKNNSPENLLVMTNSEHARLHAKETTRLVMKLRCPECGRVFYREKRKTHLAIKKKLGTTFCSRRCRGSFSRKAQLGRLTQKDKEAVENCVLAEGRVKHTETPNF